MKTKKQLSIIILITCLMVTGIVYGEDPVKGATADATTSVSGKGLGWQEMAIRTPTLVSDGIKISAGPSVGTSGLGFSLSFSSNFNIVDCCKPCGKKESWCNFNADDERCAD